MTARPSNVFAIDPDEFRIPEALPAPAPDVGEVVVLLVDREAREAGWAGAATTALARAWSGKGLRVLLADGDLTDPTLHEILGVENGEGVGDLILYGASPGRVSRTLPDAGFLFIPAGTAVPDPADVYAHPRWSGLLTAFRESGSALLLYLPAESERLDGLVAEGDRVLRFSSGPPAEEPDLGVTVIHTGRGGAIAAVEPTAPEQGAREGPRPSGSGGGLLSSESERLQATEPGEPAAVAAVVRPPNTGDPDPAGAQAPSSVKGETSPDDRERAPRREHRSVAILLSLLVLLVLGIVAAAWLGYVTIPGIPLPPGSTGSGILPSLLLG